MAVATGVVRMPEPQQALPQGKVVLRTCCPRTPATPQWWKTDRSMAVAPPQGRAIKGKPVQQVQGQHRLGSLRGSAPGHPRNDAVETGGQHCRPGDQGVNEFPEKVWPGLVRAVAKHQNFHGVVQGPDPARNVVVLLGSSRPPWAADDVAAMRVMGRAKPWDQGRGGVIQVPGDQHGFIVRGYD